MAPELKQFKLRWVVYLLFLCLFDPRVYFISCHRMVLDPDQWYKRIKGIINGLDPAVLRLPHGVLSLHGRSATLSNYLLFIIDFSVSFVLSN